MSPTDLLTLIRRLFTAVLTTLSGLSGAVHLHTPHQVAQVLDTAAWIARSVFVLLILAALVLTVRLVRLTLTLAATLARILRGAR